MASRRRASALVTVLFTDIVGSTEISAERGDRRWRELLTRHHRIIRGQLRRFGGREADIAGDGFLAIFREPAEAGEGRLVGLEPDNDELAWAMRIAERQWATGPSGPEEED